MTNSSKRCLPLTNTVAGTIIATTMTMVMTTAMLAAMTKARAVPIKNQNKAKMTAAAEDATSE